MFDESRHRAGAGGGAYQQGRPSAQSARVSQRSSDDRLVEPADEPQVFAVAANLSTLALVNGLRAPKGGTISVRLFPLAATPRGIAVGENAQNVGVPLAGLFDWIDRTFPPDDEHAFVASMRDLELLARAGWESAFPARLEPGNILNFEDIPADVGEALAQPPSALAQCALCRWLCVRGDFVWKEKELCAWDFHAAAFGKRGPWHEGIYEARHFETLPACAYVVPELLDELAVDILLAVDRAGADAAHAVVNALLANDSGRPHLCVKTDGGLTVLGER